MRATATQAQANAIADPSHLSSYLKVSVDDGSGNFQDLTDLRGYNWVVGCTYDLEAGQPLSSARVSIVREIHKMSLAPFVDGSILNASGTVVDIGRAIKIEVAVLPQGASPTSSDWAIVFEGTIQAVNWETNPMSLRCADKGYKWLRRYIEEQYVYAEDDNLLEEVCQDIIDDNTTELESITPAYTWNGTTTVTMSDTSDISVGDYIAYNHAPYFEISAIVPNTSATILNPGSRTIPTGVSGSTSKVIPGADRTTLYVEGSSPTWAIRTYYQEKNKVLTALRLLAQQIGWEINYRWNETNGTFELTLWEPDRSKSTPEDTIGPDIYGKVTKLSVDDSKIRNKVKVTALTTASGRTTVTREDSTSQAKYGVLFMEVTEGSTGQIDTVTEMQTMGDAILDDLKEPEADLSLEIPYRWDLQLGDLLRFEQNGTHFDSDQDLAPVKIRHSLQKDSPARTVLSCRGTPSGGVKRWLQLEGLPGVAPPVGLRSDEQNFGIVAEVGLGTLIVTYDDPRTSDPPIAEWLTSKCYVDTSPGFTPGSGNLAAIGKTTRFEINGLVPGVTYYAKIYVLDGAGNETLITTEVSEAVQRVGPYHENTAGQQDQLLRNNDFNIYTNGTTSDPDFWTSSGYAVAHSAASPSTGGHTQVLYTSGGVGSTLTSDFIPITYGDILQAGVKAKASAAGQTLTLSVLRYDSSQSYLGTQSVALTVGTSYQNFQLPPFVCSAAFVKVSVAISYGGSAQNITVDKTSLLRGYALGSVSSASGIPFSTSLYVMEWASGDIDSDDVGVTHQDSGGAAYFAYNEIAIDYPGIYLLQASVESDSGSGGTAHSLETQLEVDPGGAGAWATVASGQAVSATTGGNEIARAASASTAVKLDEGDLIRVRAKTSIAAGGARVLYLNKLTVRQLLRLDQ